MQRLYFLLLPILVGNSTQKVHVIHLGLEALVLIHKVVQVLLVDQPLIR